MITRRDKVAPGFEGVPECAGEAAVVVEQLRLSDPLSGRPLVDGSDGKESADVTFEPLPFADVAGGMKGTVQAALAEVPASDAPFAFSVRQACGPADEALPTVTVTLKDVTVAGGVRFVEEAAAAWRSVGLRVSEDGAGYVAVHPQRAWEMRVDAQGNDLVIAGVGTADEPTGPLPAGFEEDSGRCG